MHRMDDRSDSTRTAVLPPDAQPVWGGHDRRLREKLDLGFIASSWALCFAATLALAALVSGVFTLLSQAPLTGITGTELGVLGIIFGFSTFVAFVMVMTWRLQHVSHDRLVNSMSVAAVHTGLALILFLGELAGRTLFGVGASETFEGGIRQQVGNVFLVLERSAAASVLACLLAVGMVPAYGSRPEGTQHAAPEDRTL
jgi:hypothetical protein